MVVRKLLLLLLLSSACVQDGLQRVIDEPGDLDANFFRCAVQPILTKSCAFMDCHGNDERPLRVYAEQRFRLNVDWLEFETAITEEELRANLRVVAGFVEDSGEGGSLLSEKPLDARFGGRYHRGRDLYGVDDVYLSTDDEDYKTLRSFAGGAAMSDECQPLSGSAP
jgi:hypothetical protein